MTPADPTPEELLELAIAAMPDDGWCLSARDQIERWPSSEEREVFNPINNQAHAWAVYKFWLAHDSEVRFVGMEEFGKNIEGGARNIEQDNLSAAVAVLRKMKGR